MLVLLCIYLYILVCNKTNLVGGHGILCNYQLKRTCRTIDLKVCVSSLHFENRKSRIRYFAFAQLVATAVFKGKTDVTCNREAIK